MDFTYTQLKRTNLFISIIIPAIIAALTISALLSKIFIPHLFFMAVLILAYIAWHKKVDHIDFIRNEIYLWATIWANLLGPQRITAILNNTIRQDNELYKELDATALLSIRNGSN